ncbi:hypothetical protein LIER_07680 [Lithospermum erythrorhizon]|uniref:Uncharacterized protein n=1 Tax=Lithospermum erythrorhizon TaxID=34254 RepID=A0AAV3P9A7_LITER
MDKVKLFDTNEDEWEIINNDGFVYKRKKRRICPTSITASSAHPPTDPEIAEKKRRERKKNTLMKLKEKYYREISQWEILSNTFKTMQLKAKLIQETRQDHLCDDHHSSDCAREWFSGDVLDELLGQVEAQEAVIQDISKLCNISNGLCKAEEEKLKQSLIELPIWDYSPQQLMASLSQD